jgi:LysR family nitrogen assimilation transcriptional regulator
MAHEHTLDLRQVAYFVRVAELGSFTKAAADLDVAQSALSRHVAHLERRFETRLLHRTGRGVVLTDEGQQVLARLSTLHRDELRRLDEALSPPAWDAPR